MRGWTTSGAVAAALLIGGCSFQSTLDKMVPRERQAEIVSLGERFCTDSAGIAKSGLLHPALVASIEQTAAVLPGECPGSGADWQLVSYRWNANMTNGLKQRQEEAVVVGAGDGKWTTVTLRFHAEGDAPMRIVTWNVIGSKEKPAALAFIDEFDATAKALRYAAPIALILLAGLVFWLVRRHRAAKRPAA